MPDQIYIGNFPKGLVNNLLPFNIDNNAFPYLLQISISGGVGLKKKRGTSLFLVESGTRYPICKCCLNFPWQFLSSCSTLMAGEGNLLTGPWTQGPTLIPVTLEANSSIVPGSVVVVGNTTGNTYVDTNQDGILLVSNMPSGTIIYSTGVIQLNVSETSLTGTFSYYPSLPVLGLEDFVKPGPSTQFPLLIAFDTTYAYQVDQTGMPFFYSVSFYKNTNNPVVLDNFDYAQFWSCNYQNAFWVTNNNPGFNFMKLTNGPNSIQAATATRASIRLTAHGLNAGDFIFINEVTGPIGSGAAAGQSINGLTGIVVATGFTPNGFNADFLGMNTGTSLGTFVPGANGFGGIAQYLTTNIVGQDGIRWYDGDPTGTDHLPDTTGRGWVNFAPPLTGNIAGVSIDDEQQGVYYLVGALAIVPFKDRLLFFSPYIQTSSSVAIPLTDVVLWSWNGTPYYSALVPTVPDGQETFDVRAYYVDQTGFGGYLPAGISQPILTVLKNEDVILVGFGGAGTKSRFVYTSNDLQPFLFYFINSQLPSSSTFSGISLDRGGIDIGQYGITITTQQSCERIDLEIPDMVFQIQALNNGQQRVNAVRDFFREWIYFTFPIGNGKAASSSWIYPVQSLLWNYRDNTWAILRENFTHQGTFRKGSQYTWATLPFPTWNDWRESWNSGSSQALVPSIIGGTPQGYVLVKGEGTSEAVSGYISNIANDGSNNTQITSFNHCVNIGDYLSFGGPSIGMVILTSDANTFTVDIPFPGVVNGSITAITQSTQAVVSLEWFPASTSPFINSYFVGQTVSISGVVGMTELNGNIYTVMAVTPNSITLNVDSTGFTAYSSGGTVTLVSSIGLGSFSRLTLPLLQTKQFPIYWNEGRQVRVGVQKYLFDRTENGEVTINIYLSQDPTSIWNYGAIVPSDNNVINSSLVYSQTIFTCPESINLGLTTYTSNLQMPTAASQFQIWHRMNTSLIGNTFQLGVTLSDAQMRDLNIATSEVALHAIQIMVDKGPHLC